MICRLRIRKPALRNKSCGVDPPWRTSDSGDGVNSSRADLQFECDGEGASDSLPERHGVVLGSSTPTTSGLEMCSAAKASNNQRTSPRRSVRRAMSCGHYSPLGHAVRSHFTNNSQLAKSPGYDSELHNTQSSLSSEAVLDFLVQSN
jgi:hypothetical protein